MLQINKNINITIPLDAEVLFGNLFIPENAQGIVLFAHGSGSSRFSPRNQYVANFFNQFNLATILFDLLTEDEEKVDQVTREFRFNIPLLAERLVQTTNWVLSQNELQQYKIGYFGSSTGAAAAIIAAARCSDKVFAVVSRGGRPDLADEYLPSLIAPTLLIVGGNDHTVIKLNQEAQSKMLHAQIKELNIVDDATHLFEEPGKLDEVVDLACQWFKKYLTNT